MGNFPLKNNIVETLNHTSEYQGLRRCAGYHYLQSIPKQWQFLKRVNHAQTQVSLDDICNLVKDAKDY